MTCRRYTSVNAPCSYLTWPLVDDSTVVTMGPDRAGSACREGRMIDARSRAIAPQSHILVCTHPVCQLVLPLCRNPFSALLTIATGPPAVWMVTTFASQRLPHLHDHCTTTPPATLAPHGLPRACARTSSLGSCDDHHPPVTFSRRRVSRLSSSLSY